MSPLLLLGALVAAPEGLPLDWELHGYYRVRLVHTANVPIKNPDFLATDRRDLFRDMSYSVMRLRLEPVLKYGPNADDPIVSLHAQIDGLDDVVFGDNALIADTPIFGDILSATSVNGVDIDTLELKRVWMQLNVMIGQLRVGRMASNWGLGLLANGGDGIAGDFGDAQRQSTADRILFATRPLTILNVAMGKAAKPTPWLLVFAYDKIVEDPHVTPENIRFERGAEARSPLPFVPLTNPDDDVTQLVFASVWNDKKWSDPRDELTAGAYVTHRTQSSSESKVTIVDLFWRIRQSLFGPDAPALLTEGELLTIQGTSRAISAGTLTEPNIWSGVVRLGATDAAWDGILELGYASGDAIIADGDFTSRPMHPSHRVGLLMFPVLFAARTASQFASNPALWSRGGVYNASYLYPHARYRPFEGAEIVGAALLAYADALTPVVGGSERDDGSTGCAPFQGDCFLGVEGDLAFKLHWGKDDLVRWSTEAGILKGGAALERVIGKDFLWTLQSRIAVVF